MTEKFEIQYSVNITFIGLKCVGGNLPQRFHVKFKEPNEMCCRLSHYVIRALDS